MIQERAASKGELATPRRKGVPGRESSIGKGLEVREIRWVLEEQQIFLLPLSRANSLASQPPPTFLTSTPLY